MPKFSVLTHAAMLRTALLVTTTLLAALPAQANTAAGTVPHLPADSTSVERKPVPLSVELPLIAGWHEGQVVYYISTDASDKEAAKKMGVNYAPRLEAAIPLQLRVPGQSSALERIYVFANSRQANVLPSMPQPTGPDSANPHYSPLWLMHTVTWLPGQKTRVLRSEEEVLAAADKKQLTIQPTRVIVNCPVILSSQGGALPQAKFKPTATNSGANN